MYTILVAIDDDERRAMAQASAVVNLVASADEDVTAYLCHVFSDNPEGASVTQLSAVRRAQSRLEEAGVTCEPYESSGEPAAEILTAAKSLDVDAICVSGRKRTPTGKAVFGSVTQDVLQSSDRPVLTTPLADD